MAHVESYAKRDVKGVLKEHDRTATTYKNDVDLSRSNLNWGYGASDKSSDEVIRLVRKRCNEIMDGESMKDNTNILCDWCVTYPFEFCTPTTDANGRIYNKPNDMAHCKKFFDVVNEFACNRYGKENVIACYVHMDETTPHIDINFVPEAISRKTGRRTVSSASLLTRTELSQFQKELDKEMELTFGQKGMILNGRTKGNYTVSELKQRTKDTHDLQVREENVQMQEIDLYERAIADAEALAQERDELHLEAQQEYQVRNEELDAERADILLERKRFRRDCNEFEKYKQAQEQQMSEREVSLLEREKKLCEPSEVVLVTRFLRGIKVQGQTAYDLYQAKKPELIKSAEEREATLRRKIDAELSRMNRSRGRSNGYDLEV